MDYRKLNDSEIKILEAHGCTAENWATVFVKQGFEPNRVWHVRFLGQAKMGVFEKTVELDNGRTEKSGLYNTVIKDCTIGDNVYVSDVKSLVNYEIGSDAIIYNVASLIVVGNTAFGNGTEIEVLNEGGGREIKIFDRLTSQVAYLAALYRHNPIFIEKLNGLIEKYVETKKASVGIIGNGAVISDCSRIKNVYVGESATISGALYLEEGTIESSKDDPTFVGEGVVAKGFIILSGSRVDGSAILDHCFVGQTVRVDKQYSGENSCFFANSEAFHGEGCSIFAGPYTVTHHKSTLLIAALFSFYNAGSGTNASNHMYKLGPVHQGILERGAKTGSFSYMLWPCRVGAFTGIIGKHYVNFDVTDFPFSYVIESNGKSLLMPAMNLFTVGTRRDSEKWPNRDRRKGPEKYDLINFELFNPYTIGKIIRGMDILKELDENTPEDQDFVKWGNVFIKRPKLKTGYENYETALKVYIGNEVVKRLEKHTDATSLKTIIEDLFVEKSEALGVWVDLSGLLAPKRVIDDLLKSIQNGDISTISELINRLKNIYQAYDEFAWAWCLDLIKNRLGVDFRSITKDQLLMIVKDWKENSIKFNNMVLKDAGKEFSEKSRIGYGIDGDEEIRNRDFEAVRGKFEEDKFVAGLKKESSTIEKRAEELVAFLQKL